MAVGNFFCGDNRVALASGPSLLMESVFLRRLCITSPLDVSESSVGFDTDHELWIGRYMILQCTRVRRESVELPC